MTVAVPADALRDAITNEDWDLAKQILGDFQLLIQRTADNPPPDMDEAAWAEVLREQDALRNEVLARQTVVAADLQRLARQRAGIRAYEKKGL